MSHYTLKDVTKRVKKKMLEYDEVTPDLYASLFCSIAKELGITCDVSSSMAIDFIDQKLEKLALQEEQTVLHIDTLDKNTKRAVTAMGDKDEGTLKAVLEETKALREEVNILKRSIYIDDMTQAYNRKWFVLNYVDDEEHFAKEGTAVWLDMNDFKTINDTHGHVTGDKVLLFLSLQLQKSGGKVVRFGGDEFMVIYDTTQIDEVKKAVKSFQEDIENKTFKFHEHTFKISFAYGMHLFHKGDELEPLLHKLDVLMYKDKAQRKK